MNELDHDLAPERFPLSAAELRQMELRRQDRLAEWEEGLDTPTDLG